jgi:hypothetical protein
MIPSHAGQNCWIAPKLHRIHDEVSNTPFLYLEVGLPLVRDADFPGLESHFSRTQIRDRLVNMPGLPAVSQFHFWQTKYGQSQMNTSEIDSVILLAVGEHWTKIAKVIARVVDAVSHDLPPGDGGYEVISQRIEALVHDGRLLAQDDTKNWRFSEVRRKSN